MFHYRITKYDPALRNALGHYKGDDWTSSADIGRSFDGQTLTTARYLESESSYVDAIMLLAERGGHDHFVIHGLERGEPGPITIRDDVLRRDTAELLEGLVLRDQGRYPIAQLPAILRLNLREHIWVRLLLDNCYIRFGYDYYMYASAEADHFGLGDKPYVRWEDAIYVEPLRASPWAEDET